MTENIFYHIYNNDPREQFTPIYIKATIGIHSLLKNGQVPVIGHITDKKRHEKGGGCIIFREVCFHYDTPYPDFFYFENKTMVHKVINIKTPEYLKKTYLECAGNEGEFIENVLVRYVLTRMGFMEE